MAIWDWFGKETVDKTVTGIGTWIDEQQFTPEEQIKYKMELFQHMTPFKHIQRIMVTIIMRHWMLWGTNCFFAMWIGYFTGDMDYHLLTVLINYAKLEMVWVPTAGAVSLYLSGGLPVFKGKNNEKR